MAAASGDSEGGEVGGVYQHHAQRAVCASRAKYREGRRPRAVKVYTINLESRYLLIQGVPALGVMKELVELFALYGTIEEYNPLDDYPAEEFTEVYLIKFQKIQSARVAKRKLDERSFFGSLLHVCYAPEFETVQETREKLQDRRKYIAKVTNCRDQFQVKKQNLNAYFQKTFQPDAPGFHTSEVATNNWNLPAHICDPGQSPCYKLSLNNAASASEECYQNTLSAPQYASDCAETSAYCSQRTLMPQSAQHGIQSILAHHNLQRELASDSGVSRFMPRTTQLQERKRRREEGNKFALIGKDTDNTEIMIGPRLPEPPKIDMDDESLNTSASLIRNKLKEVTLPVQVPELSGEMSLNIPTKPTVKQRRRI
ncbi:PREDICTED: RNA-binding protein 48 [Gekko japonicus]|uniref:RNA-binding protein 48 n=1 Tax=Gekko japonicus TaxID=146911 RepID=A0ABM1JRT7_GEKJA|nr:PREDICTED: RNA-binding protein 48 [Gekko japonicus]